jgi:hypothetical protein
MSRRPPAGLSAGRASARADLKRILEGDSAPERLYYAAKILREARFEEVWDYLSPRFLSEHWQELRGKPGRRKEFWEFLYGTWQRHGLVS